MASTKHRQVEDGPRPCRAQADPQLTTMVRSANSQSHFPLLRAYLCAHTQGSDQPNKRKAVLLDQLPPAKAARRGRGASRGSGRAAAQRAQHLSQDAHRQSTLKRPVRAPTDRASGSRQPSRDISRCVAWLSAT